MVKRWHSLSMRGKLRRINKAIIDPTFFAKDPYMLNTKLFPVQKKIMGEFYYNHRFNSVDELVVVAGRRGGKTVITSVIEAYELFKLLILKEPWRHYELLPDSWIYLVNLATEEKQAKRTIFSVVEGVIDNSPFFQDFNQDSFAMHRAFPEQKVDCLAIPSSAASQVGTTVKAVFYDEIARLAEKRGDDNAWFVYDSLRGSTKSFGLKGIKVSISSPVHSSDIIMTLYDEAEKNPHILAYMYKSWEMNPRLTIDDFASDFARDPRTAMRDYGCDPSRSEYLFFDNPAVLRVNPNRPNLLECLKEGTLSPSDIKKDYTYVMAGDPAYRINAFGIAFGHAVDEIDWTQQFEDDRVLALLQDFPFDGIVIDGLWRFEPSEEPIRPAVVIDFLLDMVKTWDIGHAGFDTWQFPTVHERLQEEGVEIYTEQVKKDSFDAVKDLLSVGRLDICNYDFVLTEMKKLILNKSETKVIKPRNASKDVTDAMVHVVKILMEVDFSRPNPFDYYGQVI